MKSGTRGSALTIVIISTAVVSIIAASTLALINTQRRLNLRKELQLHANNAAEAAVDYAYSYIINDIDRLGVSAAASVPTTGSMVFSLPSGAVTFLTGDLNSAAGLGGTLGHVTFSAPVVRVGAPQAAGRYFVDPSDPANATDPNVNQWVYESVVPIVAKITATSGGSSVTSYVEKRISLRQVPLFQHAIFFSGQLQLHRGYRPLGDIHSNGALLINAHDGDTAKYTGFVSTAGHMYRGSTMCNDVGGTGGDAYGYTRVTTTGDLDFAGGVNPVATGDTRITIYTGTDGATDNYANLRATFDSRMSDWKEKAVQVFDGHLTDASHEKPALIPTGSDGYRLDAASTLGTNEFNNGPYSLIEPLLPTSNSNRKSAEANEMNLEANASLILRVEALDPTSWPDLKDVNGAVIARPSGGYTSTQLKNAANIADVFVIKGYKYSGGPNPAGSPALEPVTLPSGVIGAANSTISAIGTNLRFEPYTINNSASLSKYWTVSAGLHDPRLGRGVDLLTLDMAKLKAVMDKDPSACTGDDLAFRTDFSISNAASPVSNADWRGIVYVEFPTSLDLNLTSSNTKNGITSYAFDYGSAELRHPDRSSDADSRVNRTDHIVPIAPQLRRYPSSASDATISNRFYAIPAVQLINAKQLPSPDGSPGFTLATNAPLYLKGSYNSDGSYTTGTNIDQTAADAYSTADSGEVPSAIFCDTFTVLSDSWTTNRPKSFHGVANASTSTSNTWGGRKVTKTGTNRIEIGACIATGEFPIFEFFFHALEDYAAFNGDYNPIIVKGSTVGMFHSEIQHIKAAYARSTSMDIQTYWHAHGANAFTTVRYHDFLVNGNFPPGTPIARITALKGFRILRPGEATDQPLLAAVGF